jgi:hypothetical protein
MIAASIVANDRDDPNMMRRLFNEISDLLCVAALRQAIEFFERRRFPWNDRYVGGGRENEQSGIARPPDLWPVWSTPQTTCSGSDHRLVLLLNKNGPYSCTFKVPYLMKGSVRR